jgi:hypothetical protein
MQAGRTSLAFAAASAALGMMAQAPADSPIANDADIDAMCMHLLDGRIDLLADCRTEEENAHGFVQNWLGYNYLLGPDGSIDGLQIVEAQSDPMAAVQNTPAAVAGFCLRAAGDWIAMRSCISALDQTAMFTGNGVDPGAMGPGPSLMGADPALPGDPGAP